MTVVIPRKDFVIVEDYFSPAEAHEWLSFLLRKGEDTARGFHHPDLKPNRFHARPKYPVKKFMCYGLYWNPLDYTYTPVIPSTGEKPFAIPARVRTFCHEILRDFFPYADYSPQTILVNYYTADSTMGLHVDKDEEDHAAPVIGLNFGSSCRFFFEDESGEMKDVRIPGNSVYVFGGSARLMRHGLGSIYAKTLAPGSEQFLSNKERINITIRQVFPTD
jgi:DNA alkylation damage repair protein AlkB